MANFDDRYPAGPHAPARADPNGPADVEAGRIHDHWQAPRDYGGQAAAAGRTGVRDVWQGRRPNRSREDPFAPHRYRYDMQAPPSVLHDGEQLLGGHAGAFSGERRGPKNYRRADERIREDICEGLIGASHLDASEVSVDVTDGVVTLQGIVPERRMKYAIEDVAADCRGVREIDNHIRVVRGGAEPLLGGG